MNKKLMDSKRKKAYQKYSILIGKLILSGLIAFVVLTFFCVFYYNIPTYYESLDGATDYKWQPNVFYSRATEGFALGKINNEGYLNNYDYNKNNNVDILIMGSSQMEAYNVGMNDSTASLLNEKLVNQNVYNIGISAHYFLTCVSNLTNAIKKYQPKKYVIIETTTVNFDDEEIQKTIDGKLESVHSVSSGISEVLQQNQLIRLLYKQVASFIKKDAVDEEAEVLSTSKNIEFNNDLYTKLLNKIKNTISSSNLDLIILYDPSVNLDKNGNLTVASEKENVAEFSKLCKENGIYFLDMSDRFREEYKKNYILPYGFSNTSVGTGHLNKYGHEMVADELYKLIREAE